MKRIFPLVLALVLSLGLRVPVLAADFADVPAEHAFYDAISYCAERGIVGGYSDGTFKPANTVTRSNFTVMLSRAFYANEVAASQTEANLAYGTFYPNFKVMLMYSILDNTSFSTWDDIRNPSVMNKGINRYDMAQLMTNIMSSKGFAASLGDKNAAISQIPDYNEISGQYKDAVANVYALGIIGGYSDGTFHGEVTMTRGQAAVVIYRLAQYVGADPGTVSEIPAGDDLTDVPNSPKDTPADQSPSTNAENEALTLRDDSAVTEANALKIIEQIKQVYPSGSTWGTSSNGAGKGLRTAYLEINGRALGSNSTAINTINGTYHVSMSGGCGGFAGLVSDAIFGGSDNGGENFPIRKLDSVSQVRPGDIIVILDADGKTDHVFAATSSVISSKVVKNVTVYTISSCDGNMNGGKVSYSQSDYIFDDPYNNYRMEAWTRYPA